MPSEGQYFDHLEATPERLEISIFLRDVVPPNMLSRLWFLELVFPPVNPDYIPLGSPAYHDWVETISYAHEQLGSQRGLLGCVRIFFNDFPDDYPNDSLTIEEQEHMSTTVAVYEWIVSSLSQLGGNGLINRCFVFGAWPWSWPDLERIEQSLERRIMGCDGGYDSMLVGKEEQWESQWLKYNIDIDEDRFVESRLREDLYITRTTVNTLIIIIILMYKYRGGGL